MAEDLGVSYYDIRIITSLTIQEYKEKLPIKNLILANSLMITNYFIFRSVKCYEYALKEQMVMLKKLTIILLMRIIFTFLSLIIMKSVIW